MRKLIAVTPLLLLGFYLLTGQSYTDFRKQIVTDSPILENFTSQNTVLLSQNNKFKFSDQQRKIITAEEDIYISPNMIVFPGSVPQVSTPITRHPTNPNIFFGSAVTLGGLTSTGTYITTNGGINWYGNDVLNGNIFSNGNPGPVIDKDGRFIISYSSLTGNAASSYSTDNGITWSQETLVPGSSANSEKSFSATDDVPSSPYYGRTYMVYSELGGANFNRIAFSYTTNGGVSWSPEVAASPMPSSLHYHKGGDIKIGPGGEVYVVWGNLWSTVNGVEDSLGFAKSTNGGSSWEVSRSNADNMNGIYSSFYWNGISTRGYPRIDVDKSGGVRNGWIYAVTPEKFDSPATDSADIILHRSTDGGTTWSASRVNQDTPGNGKMQYMPAVRVDEEGGVNVVYYDTRNTPTNDSAQIYISRSLDGGDNWVDIQVSDHKFKPKGVSGTFQGFYIGITSAGSKLRPFWCEDISGIYQAWTAEVDVFTAPPNPFNLNSPAANSRIITYPNTYFPNTFTWDTSTSTATYKWIFGSPTTSPRLISLPILFNSITILSGNLDSTLASLGVAEGDSLVGQWDIWAFRNAVVNDSLRSSNGPRAITLKRGVPALTTFNLYSPVAGTRIVTSAFDQTNINFNWSASGPGVRYKWKFGSPDIASVKLIFTSNTSGFDSLFTIPNYLMDAALATAGVLPGDSLTGQWSAWAYNAFDSLKASQNFTLTLKRENKADVLLLYDSTSANCRVSTDSVVNNLTGLGYTHQLYNRKNATATNSISFKGYKRVMVIGEGGSIMSGTVKDSIKAYLASGTVQVKARLIIFGEDIGYQFDRINSPNQDTVFCRSVCGFQYIADRPGPVGQRGLIGISINSNLTDSSRGPSMDVLKKSNSVASNELFDLYRYRLFPDSMNAIGRVSSTYNIATFAIDVEALRPAFDSPNDLTVRRFLYGAISFVDQIPTGIEGSSISGIPKTFSLSQNYPNPFNPVTVIRYSLIENRNVSLKIYDALGKQVAVLVNEKKDAGNYEIDFNAGNFASGVYFYQIQAGDFVETKRMVLLK